MSPEIAKTLYQSIAMGQAVGVDADGTIVREMTALEHGLAMLGVPAYISISHSDPNYRTGERTPQIYMVEKQVAFLREWADALELLGPKGRSQNGN